MKYAKLLKIFIAIILLWGIAIRIILLLQNRDLIIDEANIARNLYERGFAHLALPLSYEQYAPPVFLWIEKFFALLFGYSEYALRLYPFLAGIASLFLFTFVMKEIASLRSAWYPLFLMAVSYTFIRYSSEVKQYMPDMMITLAMILMALKTDARKMSAGKFFIRWLLVGSLAIWASMPAVFVLTGIGSYYLYICIRQKDYNKLKTVFGVGFVWVVQFLFYYIAILRPQANSDYLQRYHYDYFLFLIPNGIDHLKHNWYVFRELLQQASGYENWSWKFNFILMITGIVLLFKNNTAKAFLIIIPLIVTLLAAALHQFSLIPRVALFTMPLILILIGFGFEKLLQIKFVVLQVVLVLIALNAVRHFNMTLELIRQPNKDELITEALSFLKKNNISGNKIYVSHGSVPAFIYYTQIHPGKQSWSQFKDASFLKWDSNYDSLAQHAADTSAFLYTAISQEELQQRKTVLVKYMSCIDSIEQNWPRCYAYIYVKK